MGAVGVMAGFAAAVGVVALLLIGMLAEPVRVKAVISRATIICFKYERIFIVLPVKE